MSFPIQMRQRQIHPNPLFMGQTYISSVKTSILMPMYPRERRHTTVGFWSQCEIQYFFFICVIYCLYLKMIWCRGTI